MEKLDPKIDGSSKNIILENIDRLKTIFGRNQYNFV